MVIRAIQTLILGVVFLTTLGCGGGADHRQIV